MSRKIGLGLVGCGEIAMQTAGAVAASPWVRIVNCTDPAAGVAASLAAEYGARVSADLAELLSDQEVEVVVLSTPHHLHAPLALRAFAAGKHVLTEKPIACTLTEADEMIAASRKTSRQLCVLYLQRFGFPARKVRELVQSGAVGRVFAVRLQAVFNKPPSYWEGGYSGRVKTDWRTSLERAGGGVLIMNLSHNIDRMLSIVDLHPTRIYAEYDTYRTPVEVEDYLSFVMRTREGAIVSCDGSSVALGRGDPGDHFYGTEGHVVIDGELVRVYLDKAHGEIPAQQWTELCPGEGELHPRRILVEEFARSILGEGEIPVSGPEARRTLEIVRGAYLSMKRGRLDTFPVQE